MVDFLFLENYYKKDINFEKLVNFLLKRKKDKKKKINIAIFSAIQFINEAKKLEKILKENNFYINRDKPQRCNYEYQILGCDVYSHSYHLDLSKLDEIIYVGDGLFHPEALLYALYDTIEKNKERDKKESDKAKLNDSNKLREIITYNPINEDIKILKIEDVIKNINKRKVNLNKFFLSENVGIFITTKAGQSYLIYIEKIKKKLSEKFPNKRFYFFLGDNFNSNELENFPYIDCWVNTACPRIGYDDIVNFKKCLVNIRDIIDF